MLFVEQGRDEARARMLAFLPEPVVETTPAILGDPTPAERRVGPDVERVPGRAPRPVRGLGPAARGGVPGVTGARDQL